jgi:hypothetical protein
MACTEDKQRPRLRSAPQLWRQISPGAAGLPGRWQVHGRRGGGGGDVEAHQATLPTGHARRGARPRGRSPPASPTPASVWRPPGLRPTPGGGEDRTEEAEARAPETRERGLTRICCVGLPRPLGRVLRPLSIPSSRLHVESRRSECAATKDAGRTARRRSSSPPAGSRARPDRSPPAVPAAAARPLARSGASAWAARRGGRGRETGRRTWSRPAGGPGLGAPARAPTCSSPDDICKESANGQSGVYFETANNDFSRVKRQCLRARSGGF